MKVCDSCLNRTAKHAIRAEIALLWTNQIAGNTIDFIMNVIKKEIVQCDVIVMIKYLFEFSYNGIIKNGCEILLHKHFKKYFILKIHLNTAVKRPRIYCLHSKDWNYTSIVLTKL
jgi:hypothetical protein